MALADGSPVRPPPTPPPSRPTEPIPPLRRRRARIARPVQAGHGGGQQRCRSTPRTCRRRPRRRRSGRTSIVLRTRRHHLRRRRRDASWRATAARRCRGRGDRRPRADRDDAAQRRSRRRFRSTSDATKGWSYISGGLGSARITSERDDMPVDGHAGENADAQLRRRGAVVQHRRTWPSRSTSASTRSARARRPPRCPGYPRAKFMVLSAGVAFK